MNTWRTLSAEQILTYWQRIAQTQTMPGRDLRLIKQLLDDGYRPTQILDGMHTWLEEGGAINVYLFHKLAPEFIIDDTIEAEVSLIKRLIRADLIEPFEIPFDYLTYIDLRGDQGVPNAAHTVNFAAAKARLETFCDDALGSVASIGGTRSAQGNARRPHSAATAARLRSIE